MGFQNPVQARLQRDLKTQRQLGLTKRSAALPPFRVSWCDSWFKFFKG